MKTFLYSSFCYKTVTSSIYWGRSKYTTDLCRICCLYWSLSSSLRYTFFRTLLVLNGNWDRTGDLCVVTQTKIMGRGTNPRLHIPKTQALSTIHCGSKIMFLKGHWSLSLGISRKLEFSFFKKFIILHT